MEDSSDKTWSAGEGTGKTVQYSSLENSMNSVKKQKDSTLKDELPRSAGAQYATGHIDHTGHEISGEITPERMKGWSQSKNKTQL